MHTIRFSTVPRRRRILMAVMAVSLGLMFEPAPGMEAETGDDDPAVPVRDDGRRTLKQFPNNMLRGVTGLFARENLRPFAVGAIATGMAFALDDEVPDSIRNEDSGLANFVNDNLGPKGLGVVAFALFVSGRFSEDARFRAMSYDLGVTAVNTFGLTRLLKTSIDRERPDGRNADAFPSGHAASAFAMATVAGAHYGYKVGIPAYAAASWIGVSRLRDNAHSLSDVVAGGLLGYLSGRTIVRQNGQPRQAGARPGRVVRVMPSLGESAQAIFVDVTF